MGTKQILYAAIGAGDFAFERARKARASLDLEYFRLDIPKSLEKAQARAEKVASKALTRTSRTYQDLVKRGEKTVRGVRSAAPTKKAAAQVKTAQSQTKAAVTSTKKAAAQAAEAAKSAAGNL